MLKDSSKFEPLDQYDGFDSNYIEKVLEKYAFYIGLFLVNFSAFEHELNIHIANLINERTHEMGYSVIETLMVNSKIDLLCKMYLRWAAYNSKEQAIRLKSLKKRLKEINNFRNTIVHANWQSLTKDRYVRSKIVVDNDEGYVKFKTVRVTLKDIRDSIKELSRLTYELEKFIQDVNDYAYKK